MNDSELEKLIIEICQYPEDSWERRKLVSRLIGELQKHPRLLKIAHPDYADIFNDTWLWFTQNLCKKFEIRGSASDSIINLINSRLRYRIKDLYRQNKSAPISLDSMIFSDETLEPLLEQIPSPKISGIDAYIETWELQNRQNLEIELKHYIEQDPQGILRNCHVRDRDDINCQVLLQKRFLQNPPLTMVEIAKELYTKLPTVQSRIERYCLPLLRKIARDLGYNPNE